MTQAKLVTSPAEGHGLTDRILDPHYAAYSKGEPIEVFPAMVLLKVHGHGGNDTANGRVNSVRYEVTRLEPILEPGDRTDMLWKIQALYEARTSTGSQRPLPIGLAGEERRLFLLERLEDWAQESGLTGGELEAKWRETHGIGPDEDWSNGDSGIPGDYRSAGVQHLLQFAIEVGAEKNDDETDDAPPAVFSGSDADALAEADDDPLAPAEGEEQDTTTVPPVDFSSKPKRGRGGIAAVPDKAGE